jgi:gas vesicle protein
MRQQELEKQVIVVDRGRGFGTLRLLLALVGGAAAGVVAGILLAPRSGKDTLSRMRDLAVDARAKAGRLPGVIHDAGIAAREVFADGMGYKNTPQGR